MKIRYIILSAAVMAAAIFLFFPYDVREDAASSTVTVYMKDSGEIITKDYCEFISGCVFGVISPASEREAIKSAACALNTLALYRMENKNGFENNGADLTAEENGEFPYISPEAVSDEYGDYAERYMKKIRECTEQAVNYAITYNGKPICADMCMISSGMTDNGEFPYLNSVSAQSDVKADGWESICELTPVTVRSALYSTAGAYRSGGIKLSGNGSDWFSDPEYAESGTLTQINFGGVKFSGAELKNALGLRSAAITVTFVGDNFRFVCHGFGNNTGMSIACAQSLALRGLQMTDILGYFYEGTKVTKPDD